MFDLRPSTIFWNSIFILIILSTYFINMWVPISIFIVLNVVTIINSFRSEFVIEDEPSKELWMLLTPVMWIIILLAFILVTVDFLKYNENSPIIKFNNWLNIKFGRDENN